MLTLIDDGEVHAPEPLGTRSVLIAGRRILHLGALERRALQALPMPVERVDARGALVLPGLVDPHANLAGAGTESGFGSRMPEMRFEDVVSAGVTTVVGSLGTDIFTHTLSGLLAKVRQFEALGITARMYTGAFHVPSPSITRSFQEDLIYIPEVIGTGELAVSGTRSSMPSLDALAHVVGETVMAARIGGKPGVTHFHLGAGEAGLQPLIDLLDRFPIEPARLYPTHVSRTPKLLEQAVALARRGCTVDTDCIAGDSGEWIRRFRGKGGPKDRLTISSDAQTPGGSPARFFAQFRSCALDPDIGIEDALRHFAANAADLLQLHGRGRIRAGGAADLLVLEPGTLAIRHVIAKPRLPARREA